MALHGHEWAECRKLQRARNQTKYATTIINKRQQQYHIGNKNQGKTANSSVKIVEKWDTQPETVGTGTLLHQPTEICLDINGSQAKTNKFERTSNMLITRPAMPMNCLINIQLRMKRTKSMTTSYEDVENSRNF